MNAVGSFAAAGGPVVGICNGFQVLTEAELLPGALQKNAGLKFLCETVELRVETTDSVLTNQAQVGQRLRIPINHFEGNYVCDAETLAELRAEERVVVRYTQNPNGSLDDIAGICNAGPQRRRPDAPPGAGLGPDPRIRRRCSAAPLAARCQPRPDLSHYSFGDSELARERLALVADTFEPPTRALPRGPATDPRPVHHRRRLRPGVHDRAVARRVPTRTDHGLRRVRRDGRRRAHARPVRDLRDLRRDAAPAAAGRPRVLAVAPRTLAATLLRQWRCGLLRCVREAGCSRARNPCATAAMTRTSSATKRPSRRS